jgi:integrase
MYKGRRLQVKAADLVIGASTYDETVLAANQWFRQQQEWIDKEAAVEKSRPYEEDYYAELANIQSAINSLPVIARDNPALQSMLAPEVAKLKRRATLIKQTLRQEVLPPLDNTLRNPLNVSPARIKEDAALEAKQQIADRLRKGSVFSIDHKELEDHEEYIPYDAVELDDFMDGDYRNHAAYNRQMRMIDEHNRELADSTLEDRIQNEAGEFASLQDGLVARMKEETGAIDEYERGMITQLLNEHGADVPESKQLAHNIEKFLEHQHRRWATKKISAGRLGKIANTMKRYKDWTRITNVEKVGTREHIADYHRTLEDLVIAEDIKPEYANNLFGTFRMLVLWLAKAGVFKEYPHWLLDNSKDYAFPVERQKPITVPLEWVHRILDAASPRLQLCILLTLNCGFGASEIGQLEKDEYNPSEGRITHKRCKTQKSENAPTVCYKLWDNTRELLDQAVVKSKKYPSRSESENHLLINRNGYPLWYEYVANGKSSKYDNITCDFRRMIAKLRTADPNVPAITYYQFRRTSASLIYNEPRYRMYNGLWLAHSPRSVADRHYNDPDSSILDETILWLHGKIFGTDEE